MNLCGNIAFDEICDQRNNLCKNGFCSIAFSNRFSVPMSNLAQDIKIKCNCPRGYKEDPVMKICRGKSFYFFYFSSPALLKILKNIKRCAILSMLCLTSVISYLAHFVKTEFAVIKNMVSAVFVEMATIIAMSLIVVLVKY